MPPTGTTYTRRITPAKLPRLTPTSTAAHSRHANIEVLVADGDLAYTVR
jgi:hypothetical protein